MIEITSFVVVNRALNFMGAVPPYPTHCIAVHIGPCRITSFKFAPRSCPHSLHTAQRLLNLKSLKLFHTRKLALRHERKRA